MSGACGSTAAKRDGRASVRSLGKFEEPQVLKLASNLGDIVNLGA